MDTEVIGRLRNTLTLAKVDWLLRVRNNGTLSTVAPTPAATTIVMTKYPRSMPDTAGSNILLRMPQGWLLTSMR